MKANEEVKQLVKDKYTELAVRLPRDESCCEANPCSTDTGSFAEDYSSLQGYESDADLGLGCGLPTQYAKIEAGDTVIDLGSGAGNDCFVARKLVGASGWVLGIDMTEAMLQKARRNAEKLGYTNVEFRYGDIEALPVADDYADVVVSNCVLNLVPDKVKAFAETYRVLKPGGHFSISDIVLKGKLPPALQQAAALYTGCVAGAVQKQDYLSIIAEAGFINISVQKERRIDLPEELLAQHLSAEEIRTLKQNRVEIVSVTVYGEKPECA